MSEMRIKGQEIEVLVMVNGAVQSCFTDVRNFEVGFQLELLREGYLGETTDRRDEIYRGMRGRMECHYENKDVFEMIKAIVDRARRKDPNTKINIKATLNFPNGDRPRVIIPDVYFGEIPLGFGGRSDYGTISLEFEAADGKVL